MAILDVCSGKITARSASVSKRPRGLRSRTTSSNQMVPKLMVPAHLKDQIKTHIADLLEKGKISLATTNIPTVSWCGGVPSTKSTSRGQLTSSIQGRRHSTALSHFCYWYFPQTHRRWIPGSHLGILPKVAAHLLRALGFSLGELPSVGEPAEGKPIDPGEDPGAARAAHRRLRGSSA